jgi:hypothetical protein
VFEHVQRLIAVLRVVLDDVDERAAERQAYICVVGISERVFQTLLVTNSTREDRERRESTLVAVAPLASGPDASWRWSAMATTPESAGRLALFPAGRAVALRPVRAGLQVLSG